GRNYTTDNKENTRPLGPIAPFTLSVQPQLQMGDHNSNNKGKSNTPHTNNNNNNTAMPQTNTNNATTGNIDDATTTNPEVSTDTQHNNHMETNTASTISAQYENNDINTTQLTLPITTQKSASETLSILHQYFTIKTISSNILDLPPLPEPIWGIFSQQQ
ncbi:7902_t:CDS:2, partial [Ambispora leptoticha]